MVLIGGFVAVVVAAGFVAGVLFRRRSNDDVHSVEHYHQKLHTLEEMRAHPAGAGLREAAASGGAAVPVAGANGNGSAAGDEHANCANGSGTTEVVDAPDEAGREAKAGGSPVTHPASAVRTSGSSTVRLTDAHQPPPPPPPPPPLTDMSTPARIGAAGTEPMPGTFTGPHDRAMESINHRPRRLGGPLAAIAAVIVLVVILIVTGLHTTPPAPSHPGSHPHAGSPSVHPSVTGTTVHSHAPTRTQPTTSTTAPPVISAPTSTSASAATYTVGSASYALALSATSGPCWLEVTDPSTGSVLYSQTLYGGQSYTVTATGPVTVTVGAPSAFAATVNGTPVTLPASSQAPLTLKFQTPSASG